MEDEQDGLDRAVGSAVVSLAPFSPSKSQSPRRISSRFKHPTRPIPAQRQLTWFSLQGRLIGVQEATSARNVGNNLSRGEAVAWELFSPMHRVLIVAVVAVATADLKKTRQIFQLRRSVELRDQVLSTMQQKLDDLCEQMNSMKDQADTGTDRLLLKNNGNDCGATELCSCGCQIHKLNHESPVPKPNWNPLIESKKSTSEKESSRDEIFKVPNVNATEQEERRMSDLSDWCSSVTSSADIQLNTLAIEHDIYNLQKACEEKDATIKELAAIACASDTAGSEDCPSFFLAFTVTEYSLLDVVSVFCGSQRISELEDIIRRKNMIISKVKKDMMVLEQKVLHLTRLRRPSFSASNSNNMQPPVMAQNLLYDMDSSTSPSSSDSDCPVNARGRRGSIDHENQNIRCEDDLPARKTQLPPSERTPIPLPKSTNGHLKQRAVSPLKENSMNQGAYTTMGLRPRQLASSVADSKRTRRRTQSSSKDTAPQKRWV
ncbi:uncharacterized protein LOC131220682 [Magnolia sinica]|uniref:uncharacterized protein LOC131220682 n=1 Tax=Magnolia sinica TaxID=86752 RepID=UPI002657B7E4|nr:uncharacterized protein LOC131220682 [Magnolia sinica]